MAIDASIALGVQPFKAPDQMNMLAQIMQIQGAQNQNQLAQYSLGKARRQDDETNALAGLVRSGVDFNTPEGQAKLYGVAPLSAEGFLRGRLETKNLQTTIAKNEQETIDKAVIRHRDQLANVNTPQDAVAWVQAQHADPLVGKVVARMGTVEQAVASIPTDPAAFQEWKLKNALGMTEFAKQNKPTIHEQDNGQVKQLLAIPGLGGAPSVVSSVQKVADPNATLSADTSTENNKRTVAASYANANATHEIARATRDAAQITGNQNTEMKLGDDYRAQSKNFKETADAYKQISAVLDKATTSPAATLAGATKFMKMIDPGSVVRESELGMALAATGVFDRATNYFNRLQSGNVLTASQVADFKAITKQINDAAAQQQKLIDNHYSNIAKSYGLRPEMVVQDFGQGGAAPAAAAAGAVPADIAAILAKHGGGRKGQ